VRRVNRPLIILIAGPYRSGTNGDPGAIAANLRRLEEAAAPIYRLGHIPMIGEWVALPIARGFHADEAPDVDVLYDTARMLLARCDAVLRLPGESAGADQDVAIARERGLPVYYRLDDIPPAALHTASAR
jgi:hypothetical protein